MINLSFKKWFFNASILLLLLGVANRLTAQTLISGIKATTPFVTTSKNVTAAISSGKGILQAPASAKKTITFGTKAVAGVGGGGGFAADGVTATFDTANNKGEYVQFAISPAKGYDLKITGLSLIGKGTVASTTNHYAVAFAIGDSSLFNSGGATFIDSAGQTGNTLYTTASYLASGADTVGQNITVLNGSSIYLRIYMWGASAKTNTSQFTITNFVLSGSATVTQGTFSTTNASICFGGSYLFNDSLYTTAGTYTIHKTNSVGADSAATLNLVVGKAPISDTLNLIGCKSVTYKTTVYTSSTAFVDTLKNISGCDSVYTSVNITLDCSPSITSFTPNFAAYNDTVTLKGINFTGTSSVTFGGNNALSFSVVNDTTIAAVVDTGASGNITIVTPNGTVSIAGFTFNSAAIISGIKTTNPFIKSGKYATTAISLGSGILRAPAAPQKAITFGTRAAGGFAADGVTATYDTANNKGEYVQFEVKPANGYDLDITGITMRGNGTVASTTNYYAVALSVGDTTLFNTGGATFLDSAGNTGNILYRTNSYLVNGADTVGQNLKVSNGTTLYLRVYMWGAAARTNNSVFTITNFTINGTASITTSKATFSTTNASICYGASYLFNNTTYTKSGTYNYVTTNSVGADSTATLILTVGAAPRTGRPVNVVGCGSVTYNNVVYTSATTITDTLKNVAGCDSILIPVNITFNCTPTISSISSTVGVTGDSITIIGTNFSTASAVAFGGTAASGFVVVNDTTIKAVVGTGASGSITVTTTNGTATLAGFTYSTAAVITGIKTTTPFINAGNHITAAISHGTGIIQAPAAPRGSITFGTRPAAGIGGAGGFAADGVGATVDTAISKGEYVQFTVSPAKGYNLDVTGVTLKGNGTVASTTNYYAVAVAVGDSTLFNSGGATYIDSSGSAGNILNRTVGFLASGADTAGQNIIVKNGSAVYLRVYMWGASTKTSTSQFTISNFLVNGNATPIPSSTTYDTICAGSGVQFNGITYTQSGTYTAHLTNSIGFDSAAILVLTVNPLVTPSVKITSTSTTINVGDTVKFTAYPTNGGSSPTYQWLKNHSIIFGANSSTYSTNSLSNGDSIFCVLFANNKCFTSDTVVSGIIVTNVNVALSGTIKNPLGTIIPTVSVAINGANPVVSDSLGNYSVTVRQGSNNIISPSKDNDKTIANGINGTDISLIQSHILKKVILNSPYKLIAGDVNNDGLVNGTDIALIKSIILKHITTFPGNRLWAFVDSSYTFSVPTKPFPYHDSISINNVTTNKTGQNFIGVKLGDVNYDWVSSIMSTETSSTPIELMNDNVSVNSTATEIHVPIRVKNFKNIMGMQYTLNFNSEALELKSIENNLLSLDYNADFASQGKLPFLWVDPASTPQTLADNTILFELVFTRKGNLNNEEIKLSSDITSVNAFDGNYTTVGIVKNAGIITDNVTVSAPFILYPNPAKDVVVINGTHIAKVQAIDNNGKVVLAKVIGDATNPSITVSNLSAGIYHIQIKTTDGKETTIRMMKK